MSTFNEKAKDWDKDPKKTERASAFANEIKEIIANKPLNRGFEFGCGTGLLSFQLRDSFNHITLADTSTGMIEVLKEKIEAHQVSNFEPLLIDLLQTDKKLNGYDAVFTMMTLHHILDVDLAFQKFNALLNVGGQLFIGDLVTEDGSFHSHEPEFDGHKGFDTKKLAAQLAANGFKITHNKQIFVIEKEYQGEMRKYPVFMVVAEKI
jgi:2-polyprenyl-3-methyl-5-hydroxy-6-metoxy-1,4-benzoquinol methylase